MNEKEIRYNHYWIYGLTIAWLVATFVHNYYTLSKYSHHLVYLGIPISTIATVLLVLALDLSVFWAVKFIAQARTWGMSVRYPQSILIISTIFSILLNVRYMITASPTQDLFDLGVGAITGVLIPSYVAIFGWIEGNVAIQALKEKNGETTTEQIPARKKVVNKRIANRGRISAPAPLSVQQPIQQPAKPNAKPDADSYAQKSNVQSGERAGVAKNITAEQVGNFFKANKGASRRMASKYFNVSVGTIQNRLNEYYSLNTA